MDEVWRVSRSGTTNSKSGTSLGTVKTGTNNAKVFKSERCINSYLVVVGRILVLLSGNSVTSRY